MKKIFNFIIASLLMAFSFTPSVMAAEDICSHVTDATQKEALGCNSAGDMNGLLMNVVNAAISLIGVAAVIGIVLGGLQYSKSSGDPTKAAGAKNTIIYSVIGLIVAVLAFAIVNFVFRSV